MNAENLFVGGIYKLNQEIIKLDGSTLIRILQNETNLKISFISLFEKGILERFGYKNIDYGYHKNIDLHKSIRLISVYGWIYPQVEQGGEMSNQYLSIISFERIKYLHELQILHKTFGKGEFLLI